MWDFAKPSLLVDVSHHQPIVRSSALHAEGVAGRIVKVSQGTSVDSSWKANRDEALANNEMLGGYLFLDNRVDGALQADTFVNALGPNAHKIALFIDHEKTSYAGRGTWASWSQCVDAVRQIRARLGNRVIAVYTYRYFWVHELGDPDVAALGNTFLWDADWLTGNPGGNAAGLAGHCTPTAFVPYAGFNLNGRAVRQFGSNATVAGVHPVDVDVFYGDQSCWNTTFGLTSGVPAPSPSYDIMEDLMSWYATQQEFEQMVTEKCNLAVRQVLGSQEGHDRMMQADFEALDRKQVATKSDVKLTTVVTATPTDGSTAATPQG